MIRWNRIKTKPNWIIVTYCVLDTEMAAELFIGTKSYKDYLE
jgi:hypothetical protein